jgi:hypothetical protein
VGSVEIPISLCIICLCTNVEALLMYLLNLIGSIIAGSPLFVPQYYRHSPIINFPHPPLPVADYWEVAYCIRNLVAPLLVGELPSFLSNLLHVLDLLMHLTLG